MSGRRSARFATRCPHTQARALRLQSLGLYGVPSLEAKPQTGDDMLPLLLYEMSERADLPIPLDSSTGLGGGANVASRDIAEC